MVDGDAWTMGDRAGRRIGKRGKAARRRLAELTSDCLSVAWLSLFCQPLSLLALPCPRMSGPDASRSPLAGIGDLRSAQPLRSSARSLARLSELQLMSSSYFYSRRRTLEQLRSTRWYSAYSSDCVAVQLTLCSPASSVACEARAAVLAGCGLALV